MSRVAKNPIVVPAEVECSVDGQLVQIKGPKGVLQFQVNDYVEVCSAQDGVLTFKPRELSTKASSGRIADGANALAGTTRALINNMVDGVTKGFEKKLVLVGVGYRALLKAKILELSIGFSHPVVFDIPEGITIEVPSQVEIVIKGISKQLVGQVAAKIRGYRPPELYKGKGIRYSDEQIVLKETKK